MFKNIHLFLLLVLVSGCASFKMNLVNPQQVSTQQIPVLEVLFDMASIETAYTLGSTEGESSSVGSAYGTLNSGVADGFGSSVTSASTTSFRDKRVQDAITIFKREVENNICKKTGTDKKGYAVCRIAAANLSTNYGWFVPNFLTLYTLSLFGLPVSSYTVEIDAQIDI